MAGTAVEIANVTETRALLAKFQPDLLKELDARLTVITNDLRAGAQANLAATGMGETAYRTRTRNRIGAFSKAVTTQPGSVAHGERWSTSPGVLAAIFEFAENVRDAKPQNVRRTKNMLATLNARYGHPGRFLWQAWDDNKDWYMGEVRSTVRAVEDEYTARLRA